MKRLAFAASVIIFNTLPAFAGDPCTGHRLLVPRRPELTCLNMAPTVIASQASPLRAVIVPADISLDATPDMESRVVIRGRNRETIASKDFSSPRGANGYYVYRGAWSPDGQYFVFSLVSSGGHSPWSWPIWVYSAKRSQFAPFSAMIANRPTLSGDFTFQGAHLLTAQTWPKDGDIEHKVPVTADLDAAFASLPPQPD